MGIVFAATLLRTTFGFGDPLIASPLLAFLMPSAESLPLVALTSVSASLVITLQDWEHVQFRSAIRLLVPALVAIPAGLWWLRSVDDHLVKALLAGMIFVYATFSLARPPQAVLQTDRSAGVFGFLSGLMGGAYHTYGPPLAVYGSMRGWNPQQFRATLSGFFFTIGLVVLPIHAATGLWNSTVLGNYCWCLPAIALSLPIGTWLNRRLRGDRFLRYLHIGLLLIAASLILHLVLSTGGRDGV